MRSFVVALAALALVLAGYIALYPRGIPVVLCVAAAGLLVGRASGRTVPSAWVVGLAAGGMLLALVGHRFDSPGSSSAVTYSLMTAALWVLILGAFAAGVALGTAIQASRLRAVAEPLPERLERFGVTRADKGSWVPAMLGAVLVACVGSMVLEVGANARLLYALAPVTAGALFGAVSGWRFSTAILILLPLGALGLVAAGMSQYNDDGDSGVLLAPLLSLGLLTFGVAAFAVGMAAGAALARRAPDARRA